jgi:hypothetical protein
VFQQALALVEFLEDGQRFLISGLVFLHLASFKNSIPACLEAGVVALFGLLLAF